MFALSNLTHPWSPAYEWAAASPGSRLAFSCFKNSTRAENQSGGFFGFSRSWCERWKHRSLLAFTCFLMDAAARELWPERSERLGEADRQKEVSGSQTVRTPGDRELLRGRLDHFYTCRTSDWSRGSLFSEWRAWMTRFVINFYAFSVENGVD